jgi:DNA replication protein DnaC
MMNEPTLDKLRQLKLLAMANAWVAQRGDASLHDLDFDSRLALLVDAEALARDNKRMQKLLYDAKLRIPGACIEDLDHSARRELDRALVRQLATGRWIAEKQNVIATGMTGVGKTYVACALGQHACRLGFRVLNRRVPRPCRRRRESARFRRKPDSRAFSPPATPLRGTRACAR